MDLVAQELERPGGDARTSPVTPDEAAMIALDDRLCLALYTASRSMTARYRVALEEFGLTYPQYLVMVLLWEESSVPVGRIGERLSLESSTLSPLLKRLEAMGLISRTRDRSDERLVIIGLTRAGQRLQERAASVTLEMCRASGLGIDEMASLVGELRELDVQLKAATREARG
ncbi:MarR family winged helix-turn-helix transcriptional regulator [Microlunatus antarcticus]|uniref:DNA-binding MarR family transcriptional regulator n=1 Tax=Microlunatus antarcticus TaxID=53388 RepID=A0A7W5JTN9_9ACTN|nr:MarR family transcriptional regulator [Microlunatus antarcticus]MBB3325532.1 DNA-binding MarR family transcriptional regulator [Microlunatus antarcticus]